MGLSLMFFGLSLVRALVSTYYILINLRVG